MLNNFALTAYAILVVTGQCFCIHFLELPGFDSDTSEEHQGFKKPVNAHPNTGGVHGIHHKKSVERKHFRRMQAKPPKILDKYYEISLPARETVIQGAENTITEREMVNTEVPAVSKDMEPRNIDEAAVVQTEHRDIIYPSYKQGLKPVYGVDRKPWQNTGVPVIRENIESQNIDAIAKRTESQSRYPRLKQEVTPVHGVGRKHWHTEVPIVRENIESQHIDPAVAAALQAEFHDRHPSLKNEVTSLHGVKRNHWQNSDPQGESQNVHVNPAVETEHQNRYPPLKQEVMPVEVKHWQNNEHPIVRQNMESHNINAETAVQTERLNRYPPIKQEVREPQNIEDPVETELKDRNSPLSQEVTPEYTVERRHWLVSRTGVDSSDIPPINKDDKDATLKAKINMLVTQTVQDTDEKVKSIQDIKETHREKAPYKIGFIVSMVKKSRDVLNELFNVAVKHRDEWKALEQLKIFELIVHTNVDTTNLVRQLVEIHVQHLNSTSSSGDETTEATGGRRVVLI